MDLLDLEQRFHAEADWINDNYIVQPPYCVEGIITFKYILIDACKF